MKLILCVWSVIVISNGCAPRQTTQDRGVEATNEINEPQKAEETKEPKNTHTPGTSAAVLIREEFTKPQEYKAALLPVWINGNLDKQIDFATSAKMHVSLKRLGFRMVDYNEVVAHLKRYGVNEYGTVPSYQLRIIGRILRVNLLVVPTVESFFRRKASEGPILTDTQQFKGSYEAESVSLKFIDVNSGMALISGFVYRNDRYSMSSELIEAIKLHLDAREFDVIKK